MNKWDKMTLGVMAMWLLLASISLFLWAGNAHSADVTITGCGGTWTWNQTTNVLSCGTGSPTPPPPPTHISCAGYSQTIVQDIPWDHQQIAPTVGMTKTTAYVGRIAIPSTASSGGLAWAAISEYGDAPYIRTATVSATPCDWITPPVVTGMDPNLRFTVLPTVIPGYPSFAPGSVVYINVFNDSCNKSYTCNINVQFSKAP